MNSSEASSSKQTEPSDPKIISITNLERFEELKYLLSVTVTDHTILEQTLKEGYRTLDLIIDSGDLDNENFHYIQFKNYIIRESRQLWKLYYRIEELRKILLSGTIRTDSYYYPFYSENIRIQDIVRNLNSP